MGSSVLKVADPTEAFLSEVRSFHVSRVCLGVGVHLCDSVLTNEMQVELASVASRKAF